MINFAMFLYSLRVVCGFNDRQTRRPQNPSPGVSSGCRRIVNCLYHIKTFMSIIIIYVYHIKPDEFLWRINRRSERLGLVEAGGAQAVEDVVDRGLVLVKPAQVALDEGQTLVE